MQVTSCSIIYTYLSKMVCNYVDVITWLYWRVLVSVLNKTICRLWQSGKLPNYLIATWLLSAYCTWDFAFPGFYLAKWRTSISYRLSQL